MSMRPDGDGHRRTRRRCESSRAIAEQHRKMLGLVIRKSQVKVAVPVEVASGDVIGNVSDGKGRARGRREAPPAVTEEDRGIAALFVCHRNVHPTVPIEIGHDNGSRSGSRRKRPVGARWWQGGAGTQGQAQDKGDGDIELVGHGSLRNQGRVDSIAGAGSA